MSSPKMKVLGAYKLQLSDEQLMELIRKNYDYLDEAEIQDTYEVKREETKSVAALDIAISDADEKFDAGDFMQPDNDQVAWDEVYLSADGRSIESRRKPNDPKNFRIYFFIHYFDESKPLKTSYGTIKVPKLQPVPDYLQKLHPYTPVD